MQRQHAIGSAREGSSSRAASGLAGFRELKDLPLAADVRRAVNAYFQVALPNYRVDEADGWTLRALPSTKARKHRRRLFTLNVSNMEVLVAHFDPVSGQESGGFIVLQKSSSIRALKDAIGSRELYPAPYVTAAGNAVVTDFEDLGELRNLLSIPVLQEAARGLNHRLRSSAQVPSLQRQWHVPDFVDWVDGLESTEHP